MNKNNIFTPINRNNYNSDFKGITKQFIIPESLMNIWTSNNTPTDDELDAFFEYVTNDICFTISSITSFKVTNDNWENLTSNQIELITRAVYVEVEFRITNNKFIEFYKNTTINDASSITYSSNNDEYVSIMETLSMKAQAYLKKTGLIYENDAKNIEAEDSPAFLKNYLKNVLTSSTPIFIQDQENFLNFILKTSNDPDNNIKIKSDGIYAKSNDAQFGDKTITTTQPKAVKASDFTNIDDIPQIKIDLVNQSKEISTNAGSISTNANEISTNAGKIVNNETKIESNFKEIGKNIISITANTNKLSINDKAFNVDSSDNLNIKTEIILPNSFKDSPFLTNDTTTKIIPGKIADLISDDTDNIIKAGSDTKLFAIAGGESPVVEIKSYDVDPNNSKAILIPVADVKDYRIISFSIQMDIYYGYVTFLGGNDLYNFGGSLAADPSTANVLASFSFDPFTDLDYLIFSWNRTPATAGSSNIGSGSITVYGIK